MRDNDWMADEEATARTAFPCCPTARNQQREPLLRWRVSRLFARGVLAQDSAQMLQLAALCPEMLLVQVDLMGIGFSERRKRHDGR